MKDRLIWLDIETFGLVPIDDPILEIGFVITDLDLEIIDIKEVLLWESGLYDSKYQVMNNRIEAGTASIGEKIVWDMHCKSGLFTDASSRGLDRRDAFLELEDWLESHGVSENTEPICGSSVHFDRSHIDAFSMQQDEDLLKEFSYRNVDVSSIKELCVRFNPGLYARIGEVTKQRKLHRVTADIIDTIGEFKFYRDEFLIIDPEVLAEEF